MAKGAINKSYKINAKGIIGLDDTGIIGLEHPDTGEFIDLSRLFSDFLEKPVSLSVSYDEDYE